MKMKLHIKDIASCIVWGSTLFFTMVAYASNLSSVSDERLVHAAQEPDNWLSHGRTYDESRFSPLQQIHPQNISQLGLAWSFEYPDNRGLQATPIVVDGVMYTSGAWSRVFAHDAASGELLWQYDPQVNKAHLVKSCCGPMNRGVAVWQDKVYVGTLDGYLVAIARADGKELWRTLTIDADKDYAITGAPRVVKGNVLIGNGGAELGVRGYLSAYDALTGKLKWRFYTVPGNPADGFENAAMEKAAKTWKGEWWKLGGGGTVWDAFTYDPDLNLVYIGVGNGGPWNQKIRSPGGGDNLYLSSIVAVNADTGEYVWHYQETPGDNWDFTATQHMILADIQWQGKIRKVLMQAPKNGFFFIIDRVTGEFLSAEPYTKVNWASSYDKNGRPVETPGARYENEKFMMIPSAVGGHNWHPMSYSPQTGLVYIPALKTMMPYQQPVEFTYQPHHYNTATAIPGESLISPLFMQMLKQKVILGELVAWDPVKQQRVWQYQHQRTWNGGVLSTAANLVFQGTADQKLMAFDAQNGKVLWQYDTRLGIVAAPISYSVRGVQYIAVQAKWDGAAPMAYGFEPYPGLDKGRLLVFSLGGKAALPPVQNLKNPQQPPQPLANISKQDVAEGKALYEHYCAVCHGIDVVGGGVVPDLRYNTMPYDAFKLIVQDGVLASRGMVSFSDVLDDNKARKVHGYIIQEAQAKYQEDQQFKEPGLRNTLVLWFYDKLSSLLAWLSWQQ